MLLRAAYVTSGEEGEERLDQHINRVLTALEAFCQQVQAKQSSLLERLQRQKVVTSGEEIRHGSMSCSGDGLGGLPFRS